METIFQKKLNALHKRGFPTNGAIETTTRCNLSCDYCCIKSYPNGEMNTSQIREAITRLAEAGVHQLLLTGGECFIRNDIIDILSCIVENRFFNTVILSNGTLLNEKHINYLIKHSTYFSYLRFSFFSHIPERHDRFTGVKGSYAAAFNNATALLNGGVPMAVILNLLEDNIDTIKESESFFRDRNFRVYIGLTKDFNSDYIKKAYASTTSVAFYEKFYHLYSPCTQFDSNDSSTEMSQTKRPEDLPLCRGLSAMVALKANGDIVPCLSFSHHSYSNITTDKRPLHDIITGSRLYNQLQTLNRSHIPACSSCEYVNFCVLCPGMIYNEHGSFNHPQQQTCNLAKAYHEIKSN
jgi:radical SAM protein with 4Fe4S-binding SPASM domain